MMCNQQPGRQTLAQFASASCLLTISHASPSAGHPANPTGVVGISTGAVTNSLSISFDRLDIDTAKVRKTQTVPVDHRDAFAC